MAAKPVNFIDGLAPERQEEIEFKISVLNRVANNDPPLPFPHSSQVDGQLRDRTAGRRSGRGRARSGSRSRADKA